MSLPRRAITGHQEPAGGAHTSRRYVSAQINLRHARSITASAGVSEEGVHESEIVADNGRRLPEPHRAGLGPRTLVNFIDVRRGNARLCNHAAHVQL